MPGIGEEVINCKLFQRAELLWFLWNLFFYGIDNHISVHNNEHEEAGEPVLFQIL